MESAMCVSTMCVYTHSGHTEDMDDGVCYVCGHTEDVDESTMSVYIHDRHTDDIIEYLVEFMFR